MTSSSPPDIASLSLSSQPPHQRLHDTYDYDGTAGNLRPPYHFATSPPIPPGQPPFHPLSMNQSPLKNNKTARAALPTVRFLCPPSPHFLVAHSVIVHFTTVTIFLQQWLDGASAIPDNRSLSSPNNSDLSSGGGSPPLPHINAPGLSPANQGPEDEVIPTAIVIKNIPFNVKRETLLDIIVRSLLSLSSIPFIVSQLGVVVHSNTVRF